MDWVSALCRSVKLIEENLTGDISIEAIAQNVYISPFYLQKGFQFVTGYSMTEYIRSRRLYLASLDILNSSDKIIDIALRYGFETPESFTKAFTRFHGVSPSQMRKHRTKPQMFLPLSINISISGGKVSGGNTMEFTIERLEEFKVIGFCRDFSFQDAYEEIPKFWDEIMQKYIVPVYSSNNAENPLRKAVFENCIGEFGVCLDDIGEGKFRYVIGGRYKGGDIPEEMTVCTLPSGEWAKFECTGPIPTALQSLNTTIFKEWLPNNPDYDIAAPVNIEWYSAEGNTASADYKSGIWFPIKRK